MLLSLTAHSEASHFPEQQGLCSGEGHFAERRRR